LIKRALAAGEILRVRRGLYCLSQPSLNLIFWPTFMQTPCKINLYLELLGKRADGYHEIRTLFLPIHDLSDRIEVERTAKPGISLQCAGLKVPSGEENLCCRAARAFCQHFNIPAQHRIFLEKRIPVAAGLGGGSSDAAAVLLSLFELEAPAGERKNELHALAAGLGADVPFFLDPQPALGQGKGELLSQLSIQTPLELLLIDPGFPVPVHWSYQHADRPTGKKPPEFNHVIDILRQGNYQEIAGIVWNDLEFAVFNKFPLLRMIREALLEKGALCAHVSGSGPTLFAICKPETSNFLQKDINAEFGGCINLHKAQYQPNI
jgi:4-diphosphocytidyl-2-C-methyl-D-erythritol kinase